MVSIWLSVDCCEHFDAVGLSRKEVSSTSTFCKKGVIPSHTAQNDGFLQTSHGSIQIAQIALCYLCCPKLMQM